MGDAGLNRFSSLTTYGGRVAAKPAIGGRTSIGQDISQRRRRLGLTLAELAVAADLSVERLRSMEAGHEAIPVASLIRLGVVLRAPIDRLLDAAAGNLTEA